MKIVLAYGKRLSYKSIRYMTLDDFKNVNALLTENRWRAEFGMLGEMEAVLVENYDGTKRCDFAVQALAATEAFWTAWRECKRVLAANGWRVQKTSGGWKVSLVTDSRQVFAARDGKFVVCKSVPESFAAKRFAGKSGKRALSNEEQDYVLRSKLRGEFEPLEAEGYGTHITPFDRAEEERAHDRE